MIVLIKPFGNHSNRLMQNLHFEAFCLKNNLEFANATFDDMHRYYVSPPPRKAISRLKRLFITKVKAKLTKLNIPTNICSFDNAASNDGSVLLNRKDTCYVKGWYFRDFDATTKYQKEFSHRYSLKPEFYQHDEFCKQFDDIDRDKNNVVGVHIRRGDYKTFLGGKYFYDDDVYRRYIENLDTELKKQSTKNNIFVVFANEKVALESRCKIIKSESDWYIDQHLMGKCDYLIGPPSTFTMWASYIGETKCFRMENASGDISLEDFTYRRG